MKNIFFTIIITLSLHVNAEKYTLPTEPPTGFFYVDFNAHFFPENILKQRYVAIVQKLGYHIENAQKTVLRKSYYHNYIPKIILCADKMPEVVFDGVTGKLKEINTYNSPVPATKEKILSDFEIIALADYYLSLLKEYTITEEYTKKDLLPDSNRVCYKRIKNGYEYPDFIYIEMNRYGQFWSFFQSHQSNECENMNINISEEKASSIVRNYMYESRLSYMKYLKLRYIKILIVNPNLFIRGYENHDSRLAYEFFLEADYDPDFPEGDSMLTPWLKIWIDTETGEILGGAKWVWK